MPLAARILVLALALMTATCGQKGPLTPPAQSSLTEASRVDPDRPAATTAKLIKTPAIEPARGA